MTQYAVGEQEVAGPRVDISFGWRQANIGTPYTGIRRKPTRDNDSGSTFKGTLWWRRYGSWMEATPFRLICTPLSTGLVQARVYD
jgi:hypothetical protein